MPPDATGTEPNDGGEPSNPEAQRGNLRTRESRLREQEAEKRERLHELGDFLAQRALNTDELAEQAQLITECDEIVEQRSAIQRQLGIGAHSDRLHDPIGLNDDEKKSFSFGKLINARSKSAKDNDREAAKLELEACDAYSQQIKLEPNGLFIPSEVYGTPEAGVRSAQFARLRGMIRSPSQKVREEGRALIDMMGIETRDLSADDFSAAGALVGVDWRPQSLVELLRNAQFAPMVGVTMLLGLVGDVAIPRQTGAAVPTWVSQDGGDVGNTDQAVGQITLTPRTIGAYTDYTRQLRLQSSVAVENFIRMDLMKEVALAEDRAILYGSGAAGQPLGIDNITGVGSGASSNTGNPSLINLMDFREDVAEANALVGNLAWVTGSKVVSNLMSHWGNPNGGDRLISEMLPYMVAESNQVNTNHIFFGNWADAVVGEWGMLDLLVDPYSRSISGAVRIVIFHSCDVVVRHPESFSMAT